MHQKYLVHLIVERLFLQSFLRRLWHITFCKITRDCKVVFSFFHLNLQLAKASLNDEWLKVLLIETDKCHLFVSFVSQTIARWSNIYVSWIFFNELHFQVLIWIWCCSTIQSSQWCWHDFKMSNFNFFKMSSIKITYF